MDRQCSFVIPMLGIMNTCSLIAIGLDFMPRWNSILFYGTTEVLEKAQAVFQ